MKWVVMTEKGSGTIVEAENYAQAVNSVPGGQSARIAQYIDKRRFDLLEEETEKQDTPPYDDV
jgi:hypothetical protein